jgi:hypothetical protein
MSLAGRFIYFIKLSPQGFVADFQKNRGHENNSSLEHIVINIWSKGIVPFFAWRALLLKMGISHSYYDNAFSLFEKEVWEGFLS